jgi:hypothetical protein
MYAVMLFRTEQCASKDRAVARPYMLAAEAALFRHIQVSRPLFASFLILTDCNSL